MHTIMRGHLGTRISDSAHKTLVTQEGPQQTGNALAQDLAGAGPRWNRTEPEPHQTGSGPTHWT